MAENDERKAQRDGDTGEVIAKLFNVYSSGKVTKWITGDRIRLLQKTERTATDLYGIDLVKHYFVNNPHGKDTDNQKIVGRSVRWNGEEHHACCVTDGVLLGQIVNGIYIARTFITYDMCSGKQQEEFESCRKQIPDDMGMYEQAKTHYV